MHCGNSCKSGSRTCGIAERQLSGKCVYQAHQNPHERESCDIPLTNRSHASAQKEILNVLSPYLAIFVLRFTPFILLNGLSRTEHGSQSSTSDRCSRPRHGRKLSRPRTHVPQHLEVHSVRSEREGRAIRLGERAMHSGTLPVRS